MNVFSAYISGGCNGLSIIIIFNSIIIIIFFLNLKLIKNRSKVLVVFFFCTSPVQLLET